MHIHCGSNYAEHSDVKCTHIILNTPKFGKFYSNIRIHRRFPLYIFSTYTIQHTQYMRINVYDIYLLRGLSSSSWNRWTSSSSYPCSSSVSTWRRNLKYFTVLPEVYRPKIGEYARTGVSAHTHTQTNFTRAQINAHTNTDRHTLEYPNQTSLDALCGGSCERGWKKVNSPVTNTARCTREHKRTPLHHFFHYACPFSLSLCLSLSGEFALFFQQKATRRTCRAL